MLIGSCATVRGQVTGSLPVKGRTPNSVSATPVPSLPGSQAATRPSISPSCWGSRISGRPETTTTTHLTVAAQTLSTAALSAADQQAIDTVCAKAKRCVVVVVSGRPIVIDQPRLKTIDALVAAWLPGSEGTGVADTLFGARPFTGRLPVSWPRTLAQEPINVGDSNYDPLYPYGYGLTTEARRTR